MRSILHPHLAEGDYKKSLVYSVLIHVGILVFFSLGISLLPAAQPLTIGLGQGGGSGDFVSVGLAADIGGGEGMYKPPITPRAETAPVVEEKVPEAAPPADQAVFEEQKPERKPEKKLPQPYRERTQRPEEKEVKPGQIARAPDPGKGTRSGGGSGGGIGSGQGVLIGSGSGEDGEIQSWYIRQVEQRVGQNWLQTSLGRIERRVEAVASFVVQENGQINDITLEKSSGISSVDLAVQRAIQASNPLPRLPYELRGRRVRFQAVFQYPPG